MQDNFFSMRISLRPLAAVTYFLFTRAWCKPDTIQYSDFYISSGGARFINFYLSNYSHFHSNPAMTPN